MTWLDELDAAAEKATPGPWHAGKPARGLRIYIFDSENRYLFQQQREVEPNAAYVAACSPERIRKLIACVRAADADLIGPGYIGQSARYSSARAALDATP